MAPRVWHLQGSPPPSIISGGQHQESNLKAGAQSVEGARCPTERACGQEKHSPRVLKASRVPGRIVNV